MTPDPVRLYGLLSGLSHVRRFSRMPMIQPQNVAEHSYYVALLAGCFATQLLERGVEIDRSAVIEAALWHDAAEAITGDLPHDFKRWDSGLHENLKDVEKALLRRLYSVAVVSPVPLSGSLEERVVKVADWVELLLYVYSENRLGSHVLDIASERIWTVMLSPAAAVAIAKSKLGAAGWYADLLDHLSREIPLPLESKRHDPLILLEEGGGDKE